jgi:hypothetical protein
MRTRRNYVVKTNHPGNSFAFMFFLIEPGGSEVAKFAVRYDKDYPGEKMFVLSLEREDHYVPLEAYGGMDYNLNPTVQLVSEWDEFMVEPTKELLQDLQACKIDQAVIDKVKKHVR